MCTVVEKRYPVGDASWKREFGEIIDKIIFILMRDDEKYYVELYLYKFLFVAVRRCYTLHENRGEEVFRGAK